jgi:hypothetical protein
MNDFEGEQVLSELTELKDQVAGLHQVVEVLETLLHDCCCDKKDGKKEKK